MQLKRLKPLQVVLPLPIASGLDGIAAVLFGSQAISMGRKVFNGEYNEDMSSGSRELGELATFLAMFDEEHGVDFSPLDYSLPS